MMILCGVFSADANLNGRADLDDMLASLHYQPADHTAAWDAGMIALGQKTHYNTPESFTEALPLHADDLTIIGDIRLDNRPELFQQLAIAAHQQPVIGDAQLILAAYRKWGEQCPEYLVGDFAFAIWDHTRQALFCATDHFGNRSIFYFFDGKKFVFASTPNAIVAVKGMPVIINQNKLASLIFKLSKHLIWQESWFEHIFLFPAATTFTIDKNGIRKRKYWTPEAGTELSFRNDEEFAEAFQEVLFRAVGDRLRSHYPVTALLSGGLDSSAVTAVAAKVLEKQNKTLQVLSAVLPDQNDPVLTDERDYIDRFRSFPNINIHYITAPGRGFFSDLEALQTTIYAPNLISRHYLYTAFAEKAQELGSRTILDGGGGELGLSFHGNGSYAELFLQLRWSRLWHELKSQQKLGGESPWSVLRSQVLAPILPDLAWKTLRKSETGLNKTRTNSIQPAFIDTLRKRVEARSEELDDISVRLYPRHRRNQLNLIRTKQSKAQGLADLGPVEVRLPLMDKRLLDFCLALPLHFKVRDGYKRYTLRAGLGNILPQEVRWRTSKTPFSPDYNRRYMEQLPEAKAFLNAIGPNDPVRKIVDVEKLKSWTNIPVADEEYGTFAEKAARDLVPEGIYLIHFLRRFPEFQP
ncbi:MAG: asparagine synthase-related protein [Chitinophagaceae bacterium]